MQAVGNCIENMFNFEYLVLPKIFKEHPGLFSLS